MVKAEELKEVGLFGSLTPSQLERLAAVTETRKYPIHAKIYLSRDRAVRLFIVTDGVVSLKLFGADEGPEISFGTRSRSELFGGASFLKSQKHTVTAQCLKETELLVIETSKLWEMFDADPQFGYQFMKEIGQIYFDRYVTAISYLAEWLRQPTRIMAQPG